MTLMQIFENSPLSGLTFLLCAATILLAIQMVRKARWKEDRFIAGFVGLLSLHQSFSVLRDMGVVPRDWKPAEELAGAVLSGLFLGALYVFRAHLWKLHNTTMRLRVSEMNMASQTWSVAEIEALEAITRKPAPAKPVRLQTVPGGQSGQLPGGSPGPSQP